MTTAAIALAVFAFLVLQSIAASWSQDDPSSRSFVVVRHSVSIVMPLPERYAADVRARPEVAAATPLVWLGAHLPGQGDKYLPSYATDPADFVATFGERVTLSAADRDGWFADRRGAIVGAELAKRMGWKRGDSVVLEPGSRAMATSLQFVVSGIYNTHARNLDEQTIVVRYDYVNESLPSEDRGGITAVMARLRPDVETATASASIDRFFESRDIATTTEDEELFAKNSAGFLSALIKGLALLSTLLVLLIALVLASTLSMNVRERRKEFATLRAIGFGSGAILELVIKEALLIAISGVGTGLVATWAIVTYSLAPWLQSQSADVFGHFALSTRAIVLASGSSIAIAIVAALLPALAALRVPTTEALRAL